MKRNPGYDLPDYDNIKELLEEERKTLIKVNGFAEDEEFVRTVEEASQILERLQKIHLSLQVCFDHSSSLVRLFEKEFISFSQFVHLDYLLDVLFIDEYLIPEKEMYYFCLPEGQIDFDVLDGYVDDFEAWAQETIKKHDETQEMIRDRFDFEIKEKAVPCQCHVCLGDYRTKVRDHIFDECLNIIEGARAAILETEEYDLERTAQIYRGYQKQLDKKFFGVRFRLKRSSLNRLESQVKDRMKSVFNYPSELALMQVEKVKAFYEEDLRSQGLRRDLISNEEYERFFRQMSTNIWRGEKYLLVEFKKLVKSVMTLKRKDISAKILKDYLGEFWIHSDARRLNRKIIYHMGPTNSGKTYHAIEALCQAPSGCYLAPLRLLAGELYDTMNAKEVKTTLLTGEEVINTDGATHYSSTIEMARFQEKFDCCVIDEIQMISDPQRGWAWTRALVNINAPEVHVCGDPSAYDLVKKIAELCGDELEVKNYERMTKLEVLKHPIRVGELQRNDALIVFSRRNALKFKAELEKCDFKVSIVYGRLSPEVRREQARKFDEQETDIMVSTDAIAMGMNLPIKRIIFSTLTKHINSRSFPISSSEIKQIAGRAGRYKRFPLGQVSCLQRCENGIEEINAALHEELEQKDQCMVGPDLDIFSQVNNALKTNALPELKLSEFLRLFNTMTFQKPFYCVELKEMIEIAEMVEEADYAGVLSSAEIFGFACAPVNLGLLEHVQYFVWILNNYVRANPIKNEDIDFRSNDIDYLETSIKCVELYQWLSRHFNDKNFEYELMDLLENKGLAIDKLNDLLGEKTVRSCSSCGCKLDENSQFGICEECFKNKRFRSRRPGTGGGGRPPSRGGAPRRSKKTGSGRPPKGGGSRNQSGSSGHGGRKKSSGNSRRRKKR